MLAGRKKERQHSRDLKQQKEIQVQNLEYAQHLEIHLNQKLLKERVHNVKHKVQSNVLHVAKTLKLLKRERRKQDKSLNLVLVEVQALEVVKDVNDIIILVS